MGCYVIIHVSEEDTKNYAIQCTVERSYNAAHFIMMTSSNGKKIRVTGHLCGESTGRGWIPRTKASDAELWFLLWCVLINGWVNNHEAGDLRRNRAHYDVIVMSRYYIRHCDDNSRTYIRLHTHSRHPIVHPYGRAMGCLLWEFWMC